MRMFIITAVAVYVAGLFLLPFATMAQPFIHPGILHSSDDLQRMKSCVAAKEEPVYAGYKLFAESPFSQYTYKMQGPMEMVGRNPTVGQSAYDNDANAAHQNAIMWVITGDKRYAQKSIDIINGWSAALKSITGRDAILMAGLGPFKMVNAAEIIRYTNAGWREEDILRTERHFREVIYPVIKDYAPFANGNWDAAAIKTCMGIAVFCNNRLFFESALQYYTDGWGNGSISNYIINETGQVQESGRDQPHTQLGIGMLAECCAIALNQGLDLYGYENNRLLKGFEYTAKYNLGNSDLPFSEWLDRTGKYHHTAISDKGRGNLRAVYEQVYNHYVVIKHLPAPFVQQAVEKIRPEGPGVPGADHPGYGTLFFAGKSGVTGNKLSAPAGLIASGTMNAVTLKWVTVINASSYSVKRATNPNGPFLTIADGIKENHFTDKKINPHTYYYYTIYASNKKVKSGDAFVQQTVSGLPISWKQAVIGRNDKDYSLFQGQVLSIEAGGSGTGNTKDEFYFSYIPIRQDATLSLRINPQPSSQSSKAGIMLRRDSSDSAAFIAIMLCPGDTGQIEAPEWRTRFIARQEAGAGAEIKLQGQGLEMPAVAYGRLTGYYYLKLEKQGDSCRAYGSYDGKNWKGAGALQMPGNGNYLLGIAVASGISNTTNVRVDNILLNNKPLLPKQP